ncbi:RecT family [uncultured Caudovirales phage]|uniref:RecT family n=1 Tax=uncultured Caudovirales phage TaxID=2100421 RepID=A0A6J5N9Q7_9CAUD|nr:RecT family [uncultured Caudovirales phage]
MSNALTLKNSLEPTTLQEAMKFSDILASSTMVPRDFQGKPGNVLVAIQWGREVGLGPLQALQNIAVINGRPSIWGDAAIALVRGHPDCLSVQEGVEGEGEARQGWCEVTRRGEQPQRRTFSVSDAKRAGLWGKSGPWTQYPDRMLQLRARGFAIRDVFPDALRGVMTREEAEDMPPEPRHVENLAVAPVAPVAPAPEPVEAPLMLIGPDATEYSFKSLRTWLAAAERAIGKIEPDALGAWRDANKSHIEAVAERFPNSPVMEIIIAAIDHRRTYAEEPAAEEIAQ